MCFWRLYCSSEGKHECVIDNRSLQSTHVVMRYIYQVSENDDKQNRFMPATIITFTYLRFRMA